MVMASVYVLFRQMYALLCCQLSIHIPLPLMVFSHMGDNAV